MRSMLLQSCLTLCDPMDHSSVHGIHQATILDWVAISFSREPSWPRDRTCISYVSMWDAHILRYSMHNLSFWDLGFPGGNSGKEPSAQWKSLKRQAFYPWVRKIPWRRKWQLTPVFLPGKVHGQRSLAVYSPWGHKESYMTEAT